MLWLRCFRLELFEIFTETILNYILIAEKFQMISWTNNKNIERREYLRVAKK
jgi:hypothetical protein